MSIRVTIEGEPGIFWAESARVNCRRDRDCTASSGGFATKRAALLDMVRFCTATIRKAEKLLKKETP